jgi:hypothetical protein
MARHENALLAVRLLGRWTQLARQHVAMGSGCACGPGFGLQLVDFEQQLLEHLRARHGSAVIGRSVPEVLRRFTGDECEVPQAAQTALLADLEESMASFDELHRIDPGAGSRLA